jgi:hypothetical protein
VHTRLHASDWTYPAIAAECAGAYRAYQRERSELYKAYFREHPELRGNHPLLARDLPAALPEGWDWLAELLPVRERHRWHLSGKSSQVLTLGVLGPAVKADPQLRWLAPLVDVPAQQYRNPQVCFEYPLRPELLHEYPRVTAIDFYAEHESLVLCAEAKWTEAGLGRCSCRRGGGEPARGECAERVLGRAAYWETARDAFGLPERQVGVACPLDHVYQAVRNVAAARALAGAGQLSVFALLYDADNPYFRPCGKWPGWPAVLAHTLADTEKVEFRALSWQALVPQLPLDDAVKQWAADKHRLH